MFKERLKIVGKKVGYGLMQFLLAVLTLSIFIGAVLLVAKFPVIEVVFKYSAFSMLGVALLFVLLCLVLGVYEFIKWLFIEPYKVNKEKRNKEDIL